MAYEKQTWLDLPILDTPITASRLNHMEEGIDEAHDILDEKANIVIVGPSEALPNPSSLVQGTVVLKLTQAV